MQAAVKRWGGAIVVVTAALSLAACSGDKKPSATRSEAAVRTGTYDALVAAEPAHAMTNPVTRKTINNWVDTWNKPGQLAFTYLLNQAGAKIGYFVFEGPPVSMCAALTPTWAYENRDVGSDNGDVQVKAPSIDGVYYSGGQCLSYYGRDASTGNYLEFSIGGTQNYLLSTQPLDLNVPALGYTKVTDLTQAADGTYAKKG